MTVPFGQWGVNSFYRIYDIETLETLMQGYVIEHAEYYRRVEHAIWLPTTATELSQIEWNPVGAGACGVALIAARRPVTRIKV